MTQNTGLPAIQVKKLPKNAGVTTVLKAIAVVHTAGDPDVTNPIITDAALQGAGALLQTMETGFKSSPPTYTSKQVGTQKHIVIVMYNKIGGAVQPVAIDVANTAGDVLAGETVVTRCGFKFGKTRGPKKSKEFSADSTIEGQIDVTTKSGGAGTTYIRQCIKTIKKGINPTDEVADAEPPLVSDIIGISFLGLTSQDSYAVREAKLLKMKKKLTPTNLPNTQRSAKTTAGKKNNKTVFVKGTPYYNYGNWIHVTVK
ncbi:MAG: hypothetical protein ACYDCN_15835 [Bacteroidia bacterium]